MSTVKGTATNIRDNGPVKGKYGTQHRIGLKVNGESYSGFFSKSAEDLGLEDGKLVTFSYTEKGKYKNIDAKTLKVSTTVDSGAAAASAPSPSKVVNKAYAGVTVGMALNNACQLIAHGVVKPKEGEPVLPLIEKVSRAILALTVKLESGTPETATTTPAPVVAKKKPASEPEPEEVEEEVEEEEEEAPPPPRRGRPPAKAKPKVEEPAFDDDIPWE